MVKEFIGIQEPGYEQFEIKIGDMNVHETKEKPWGLNNAKTWNLMVDDEINVVPLERCEPKIILNKRHPLISVHHRNTEPTDKIFDENMLFEIQDEKQVNHTFDGDD